MAGRSEKARGCTRWQGRTLQKARSHHPSPRARGEEKALAAAKRAGHKLIVLDVPLLYETGGEKRCDAVLVTTVSHAISKTARHGAPGDDRGTFHALLKRQMPDSEKRRRAPCHIGNRPRFSGCAERSSGPVAGFGPAAVLNSGWNHARDCARLPKRLALIPCGGDRLVEIGCVEIVQSFRNGPGLPPLHQPRATDVARGLAVHGLSDAFLADKPVFRRSQTNSSPSYRG